MIETNIKKTLEIEENSLKSLSENLDYKIVEKIVDLISTMQGKLVVTGAGTSGTAAKKIVHTFSCLSIPTIYLNPSDAVHGSLGILGEKDVIILISKGGNTEELVKLLPSIEKSKAVVIGVGENSVSQIGQTADLFLKISTEQEPDPFNMLATASTLSVIASFDAIAIEVMKKIEFTKKQFEINHPGGAVGKRLREDN